VQFDQFMRQMDSLQENSRICATPAGEVAYMRLHAWRFRRMFGMMPRNIGPLHVLEIGPTPFTLFLKQAFADWDVWALDRTDHLNERLARGGVPLRSCDLDRARIPLDDNLFDFVICAETLEHVFAPPTLVLKEIARIMRPSGRLLLTVPNLANLRHRLRFLFGVSPLPNPDRQLATDPVHGHGHVREYTRKEIVRACRLAGFEVVKVQMVCKNVGDILRLMLQNRARLLRHGFYLLKLLHAMLNAVTPWFRGTIFVECRKPGPVEIPELIRKPISAKVFRSHKRYSDGDCLKSHPERSEGSRKTTKILRFAQNDVIQNETIPSEDTITSLINWKD
jgi:SAM-dependent methyltransferase